MVVQKVSFSLFIIITILTSSVEVSGVSTFGNYTEGQNCGIISENNFYFGKCLKVQDCLSAFNEYKNNQRGLQVCGNSADKNEKEDLICCSKDDLEKSKLKLEPIKRTLEYNECVLRYLKYRSSSFYLTVAGVADGDVTYKGQFPNMVAIGWTQNDSSVEYNCGGSIITEMFIVTAAHCSSFGGKRPDVVRVGDIDLLSDTDDEDVQQLNIASIIRHPQHRFRFRYHDIALIKVDREIKMNQFVVPACIHHGFTKDFLEAGGYGTTGFGEQKSNKLMKVNLRSIDQKECKDYYHNFDEQKLGRGIVEEQFCAKSFHFNRPAMDTCLGDSGGGLQYQDRYRIGQFVYQIPTLVGIVSFGIACGFGAPSVNTNVASYIDWMESVIFP